MSRSFDRQSRNNRGNKGVKTVPIFLSGGAIIQAVASSLPKSGYTHHHGVSRDNVQVNSLKSMILPGTDTMVISQDSGLLTTFNKHEIDVFARQYVEDNGGKSSRSSL